MDWNEDGKKDVIVGDSKGVIYIFINKGTDKKPVLEARKQLVVDGKPFTWTKLRAKPDVADWNNDGKKDLIVGEERGNILLLLNIGTNEEPAFGPPEMIKDGSSNLNGGSRVDPCVFDWNGDGKKDLVTANEGGQVFFFENKGTDEAPKFSGKEILKAKGWALYDKSNFSAQEDLDGNGSKEIVGCNRQGMVVIRSGNTETNLTKGGASYKVNARAVPVKIVDWNGDKKPDILLGSKDGTVYIAINETKNKELKFADLEPVTMRRKPINGGVGVVPDFVDWDKDGKKDLLCIDATGHGIYFKNRGTSKRPKFSKPKEAKNDSAPICAGYRARVEIADWNGDGFADLIYGVTSSLDGKGRIYVFPTKKQ